MTRARCTFKESDVRRAIRAVKKEGKTVQRIEIDPDGRIVIVTGKEAATLSDAYERWKGGQHAGPA